jgi:hypothetical protein
LVGHSRAQLWQGKNLVVLAVAELDGNLYAGQSVFVDKIYRSLRMLKIAGFERVHGPIAQAAQVKLRAHVLKQDSHVWPATTSGSIPADDTPLGQPFENCLAWVALN